MLRAFVVDADGVRLHTLGGRSLAEWPWASLTDVAAMPVSVGASERPGVRLKTTDAAPVSFAFPPVTGFGVSAAAADRAARAVREHLASR